MPYTSEAQPEKAAELTQLQRIGAGLSNIGKVFAGKEWDAKIQNLQVRAAAGDELAGNLLNLLGIASVAAGAAGGLGVAKLLGARGRGLALGTAAGSLLGAAPMATVREREPAVTLPGFGMDREASADRIRVGSFHMMKSAVGPSLLKLDAKGISLPALQSLYSRDIAGATQHPGIVALVARRKERIRRLADELRNPGSHLKREEPAASSEEDIAPLPGLPLSPGLPQPPSNLRGMFGPAGGAPGLAGGGNMPGISGAGMPPKISSRIDRFFKTSNSEEDEEGRVAPESPEHEKGDVPREISPEQSKKLQTYVASQEGLDDTRFHDYAERIGADPHEAEEVIYRLVRSLAQGGTPADPVPGGAAMGMPDSAFPQEALREGVDVEMEHTPSKAKAKDIAKDHLTESTRYYDDLEDMEEMEEARGDPGVGKRVKAYKYGFFVKFAELGIMPSELGQRMEKRAGAAPFIAGQAASGAAGSTIGTAGDLAKWLARTGGKLTLYGLSLPVWLAILGGAGAGIGYRALTAPGYAEPGELRHIELVGLYKRLGREARMRAKRLQRKRLERTGEEEPEVAVPEIEAA